MSKLKDFLEGMPSPSTRKSYKNGIKKFEEYLGYPIEDLIKSPEAGKKIEKFYVWLKGKGYTQNSCRNIVNGAIQFLKYFDTTVKYRKSIGIYRTEISTRDHRLTILELQELASVADLKEQVILEVFILGLRVGDSCRLEWKTFDILHQEAPIPNDILTKKEGQVAKTFISQAFKENLEKYLPNIDKNNKYLLQSARKGHLDEESLNWILKDLAKRANLKLKGSLHWHCGRKLFMRKCAELGINQWNAKMLCGKAVSKDILTYVNGVNLAKDFLKVSRVLRLRQAQGNGRISTIQQAVDLILKVQRKMILRELQMEQQASGYLGIIVDYSRLSYKEILEEYLKKKES